MMSKLRHRGNEGEDRARVVRVRLMAGAAAAALLLSLSLNVFAGSVAGTRHDLSTAGGDTDGQVCVFCHTPHNSNTTAPAPLWNRFLAPKTYTMYSSATMDTTPGLSSSQGSLVCLGCHDGVVANGTYGSRTGSDKHVLLNGPQGGPDTSSSPNCERCHEDIYNGGPPMYDFTLNLGKDHPIGMTYPTASQDPAFHTPPDTTNGWSDVRLFNGKMECMSCHDVHDNANSPFLVLSNAGSALCLKCHIK